MKKEILNFDFNQKRVLLRCDFNLSLDKEEMLDHLRIERTKETIDFLKSKKAKIILISHLDNPQEILNLKERIKKCSLNQIVGKLEKYFGKINFIPEIVGKDVEKAVSKLQPGEIILLENLRFDVREENLDENFAKELAKLGDVFINEAFSASHRNHTSIVLLPKYLPSFLGFNFEKEIENLQKILKSFSRPLVIIIGGVKINSKIKFIEKFIKIADHILLGGKAANEILSVKGIYIGRPLPEDKEIIDKILNLDITNPKIHLPFDVVSALKDGENFITRITAPAAVRKEEDVLDIGPETILSWKNILSEAKTVFWSGPLGFFENEKFSNGTREISKFLSSQNNILTLAGGGDTISALQKFNVLDKFSYVSTGGNAMLDFLSNETLPGIEAIEKFSKKIK
ncbi:MAG: phosphoglycerate kinase [Minisyncoccia bacterium]